VTYQTRTWRALAGCPRTGSASAGARPVAVGRRAAQRRRCTAAWPAPGGRPAAAHRPWSRRTRSRLRAPCCVPWGLSTPLHAAAPSVPPRRPRAVPRPRGPQPATPPSSPGGRPAATLALAARTLHRGAPVCRPTRSSHCAPLRRRCPVRKR
jgi:hypothetical protein